MDLSGWNVGKVYTCPSCGAKLQFNLIRGASPILDTHKYAGVSCGGCGKDVTKLIYK
jgi:DNA-directed RNA polymerase subunit RPC12/RpoP